MLIATRPRHKVLKKAAGNLKYEILGTELEVVIRTRYLGVQVGKSLDWNEHIKVISSKVSRAIVFLNMQKHPIASVKTLYKSIVEPHFRYCCSVWGCCGATTIHQLQELHNRAARILPKSSFNVPSGPLIKSLC